MFRKILKLLILPVSLVVVLGLGAVVADRFVQDPAVQAYVLGRIGDRIGFDITAGRINVNWLHGIGIRVESAEAVSRNGEARIEAAGIRVVLSAIRLLQRQVVPTRVHLIRPILHLRTRPDSQIGQIGGWPVLFTPLLLEPFKALKALRFEDARVELEQGKFSLEAFDLVAEQAGKMPWEVEISARARVTYGQLQSPLAVSGRILEDPAHPEVPLCRLRLTGPRVPIQWIPWPSFLPWHAGNMEVDVFLSGSRRRGYKADGVLKGRECAFEIVARDRHKSYSFERLDLALEASYVEGIVDIPSFILTGPGFNFTGRSRFDLGDFHDPLMEIEASSGPIAQKRFMPLVPDPILPAWLSEELFPQLSGGEVLLEGLRLSGRVSRIENMSVKGNEDALWLTLSWEGLRADVPWSPFPFQGIPGHLEIQDGGLRLGGIGASFGQSVIRDASMDFPELYAGKGLFSFHVDGAFELADLASIAGRVQLPEGLAEAVNATESVGGKMDADIGGTYALGAEWPDLVAGKFRVADATWSYGGAIEPVQVESGLLELSSKERHRFTSRFVWQDSSFNVEGSFGPSWSKDLRVGGDAVLHAPAILRHLLKKTAPLPEFPAGVPCRFSATKSGDSWGLSAQLDVSGMQLRLPAFSIGLAEKGCRLEFEGSFDLQEGGKFSGESILHLGETTAAVSAIRDAEALRLWIAAPSMPLAAAGLRILGDAPTPEGILTADLEVVIPRLSGMEASARGKVSGRGINWFLPGLAMPVRDGSFELGLDRGRCNIEEVSFRLGGGRLLAHGRLDAHLGPPRGDLWVSIDTFDLGTLMGTLAAERQLNDSAAARQEWFCPDGAALSVALSVDKALWKGKECGGGADANLVFRDGGVDLKRARVQVQGTRLALSGRLRCGDPPLVMLSGHIRAEDQPIEPLMRLCGLKPVEVEGRLTMEGVFYTRGEGFPSLKRNLDGRATVRLEQGTIRRSNLILKILEFLSLKRIVERRPDDISSGGFYFESIEGQIAAEKGILKSDDLLVKSPIFNAAAEGQLDVSTGQVEMELGVQPLGTIDSLVSRIPVVGYILSGKDRTILVYRFDVHGPVEKPEIDYVPLKEWGDSMMGYLTRLMGTPWRLVKKIGKISKEIEEGDSPAPLEENL